MGGKIIAVASGKGGVGKSFVALNLGVELAVQKKKVLVIDADVGLGNIHILLGVNPKYNIVDLMEGNAPLEECVCDALLKGNLKILAGGTGLDKIFHMSHEKKRKMLVELKKLEKDYDVVIIDIGAGINKEVISFLELADQAVIVTNPDITAIADSYALLKTILKSTDITKNIGLILNKSDEDMGEEVYKRFNTAARKFLTSDIKYLGSIEEDRKLVFQSTQKKLPVYYLSPSSKVRKDFYTLSLKIFYNKEMHYNQGPNLVNRFMKFLGVEV